MDGRSDANGNTRVPRCGDPFENPIPTKTDTHHSTTILNAFLEADGKQCAVWKDEVNTLLIFAGLFSAVVTAFLIESYKFLQPADQTTAALHRLSDKLEMLALSIRSDFPLPSSASLVEISSTFAPSTQNIRINILWFSSLVLSLTTVVIGIIALQWLRSHQWYYDDMSPQSTLGVYRMRQSAKDAWNLQGVFTSLPSLILVALILFFVGLVDFLVSLNHHVAVPIGVLAYGTLAILFITTILPSLQIFKLQFLPPTGASIPTPCPYKSPQSLIFHRICVNSINMIQLAFRYIMRTEPQGQHSYALTMFNAPLHFMVNSAPAKWTTFDRKWVQLRDFYALSSTVRGPNYSTPFFLQHPRRPIYDDVLMLMHAISAPPNPDVPFAAYHCFSEASRMALYQDIGSKEGNLYVRGYCWQHLFLPNGAEDRFGPPISELVQSPSTHLLHDENMLVFLEMLAAHNLPEEVSRAISAHICELQARILAYVYTGDLWFQQDKRSRKHLPNKKRQWLFMMTQQYIDMINSTNDLPKFKVWSQFAPGTLSGNGISVSIATVESAIIRYSAICERFVQQIAKSECLDWDETIHARPHLAQFWKAPATMLRYTGTAQIPFDPFSRFENSFNIIQATLSNSAIPDSASDHRTHDYLFLSACLLIEQLFKPSGELPLKPFDPKQCQRLAAFIKALNASEQAAGYPAARIQDNWDEFWNDTGLPKVARFDYRPPSAKRSYICWQDIPAWIEIHLTAPSAE